MTATRPHPAVEDNNMNSFLKEPKIEVVEPQSPVSFDHHHQKLMHHSPSASSSSSVTPPLTSMTTSSPSLPTTSLPTTSPRTANLFQPFLESAMNGGGNKANQNGASKPAFSIDNILKPSFGQQLFLQSMAMAAAAAQAQAAAAAQVAAAQAAAAQAAAQPYPSLSAFNTPLSLASTSTALPPGHPSSLPLARLSSMMNFPNATNVSSSINGCIKEERLDITASSPPLSASSPLSTSMQDPLSSLKRKADSSFESSPLSSKKLHRAASESASESFDDNDSNPAKSPAIKDGSNKSGTSSSEPKADADCPPGMVRGPNGQLWPAWVFCTRYSDRPSSGPRLRKVKKEKTEGPKVPKMATGNKNNNNEDKRPRTAFNSEQLQRLKKEFDENRYLTEERRKNLSTELGLHENQIKIWFQNKRAKIKKSTGSKGELAQMLSAQGLYNHSTVAIDEDEYPDF